MATSDSERLFPAAASRSPRRRWAMVVGAVGLAATALVLWRVFGFSPAKTTEPPRDPRLDYTGPFRNVHPSVQYVDDARCADCHDNIVSAYARHAMGRSLVPVHAAPDLPTDDKHHNPFTALGTQFTVERDGKGGKGMRQRRVLLGKDGQPLIEQEWQIDYVLGSGGRGHSFLTSRDGFVFQAPISWFSHAGRWDLSPGFAPAQITERPVLPNCLFCHVNRAKHVEGSVARYKPPVFEGHAIGCQRCHGPGALHVASRSGPDATADPIDGTIVHPRHLTPALRNAICEQCHLQGQVRVANRGLAFDDFRPGLPAEVFRSVFLRGPEAGQRDKAINHVEQMYASRCFQEGQGERQLSCVSCHDPHERISPARRVVHYRERCLTCHQQQGCSVPEPARQLKQDSCIDCHMPRYGAADIPHTASTDHRIPRHGKSRPNPKEPEIGVGKLPLISFYRDRPGVSATEEERGRALGIVKLALVRADFAVDAMPQALVALEAALKRDPHDLPVVEARGFALGRHNRLAEALAAFEEVLAAQPEREMTLVAAAATAEALAKVDLSLGYWRRAVAANPWSPDYRRDFVQLLIKTKAWPEAQREADAWVGLDPFSAEARAARLACLVALGEKQQARDEFARLEALAPANLQELRIRFERKLR
jgi:hypothetical protein